MPNRLVAEKSPYLLQHAHNPVDWYPWGNEALELAKREDRPILVSIGYSACHWCHVMEHESFEDEVIAAAMNERFVNIKVDREERPDVDAIYMEAVQAMTGQGGWPLNVFLTPDGRPFYGGTYFPPLPRQGMPSWSQVLQSVAAAYAERREDVLHNAEALTNYIRQAQQLEGSDAALTPDLLVGAYGTAARQFDWEHGGFGAAPKFPQPLALEFVLRMYKRTGDAGALEFVQATLRQMASGGIYDHLGGGFHRYTVDGQWVVPHFEKMLYDNALLARVYLYAYQVTGEDLYRTVVEETLNYLLRDMRSPGGGFYSAEDADSEGVEGKYYVWTPQEVAVHLDPADARIFSLRYGVRPQGNFEGRTILTVAKTVEAVAVEIKASEEDVTQSLKRSKGILLRARSERVPPGKDTKILTAWNALAICALAEAGRVLERRDYVVAAREAASFILDDMRPGGRLVRSYRDGPSQIPAFLEDYSYLAEALLALYETVFDIPFFVGATQMVEEMVTQFSDPDEGAFFDVATAADDLVVRPRSFFDNPIPSGNSAASMVLLRLHALTGEEKFQQAALPAFRAVRDALERAPLGFAYLLCALDFYLSSGNQIAIVPGPDNADTAALLRVAWSRYLPNAVVAVGEGETIPLLAGRNPINGRGTAYVCEHFSCRLPVTDPIAFAALLNEQDQQPA